MNRSQAKFLEDALDMKDQLNDWEQGFLDSLNKQQQSAEESGIMYRLSYKQNLMLNKIVGKIKW